MSKPIIIAKEAIAEVEEAKNYYNSKVDGLGQKFVADFFNTIELISIWPKMFPKGKRAYGAHTAILKQFPYQIHYYVGKDEILALVVSNCYQQPAKYKKKIKERKK